MYCCKFPSVILILFYVSSVVLEKKSIGKGCYYKGSYHHGNWTDGCEFNCTCLNTDTGHYKCQTRCPVYPRLPPGCLLKLPVGEECCKQPDCSAVTVPYTVISNNNRNHNNNDDTNGDTPTDKTRFTEIIDINGLSGNTSTTENGEEKGCFYKGKYYRGNWTDGCEFNCSCEDPASGIYRCWKRCREYTELDPGCILKLPTFNDCCKVPACNTTYLSLNKENNNTDKHVTNINNDNRIKTDIYSSISTITSTTLPPILVAFSRTTSALPDIKPPSTSTSSQKKSLTEPQNINYKVLNEANKTNTKDTEVINATETEKLAIIFSRFGPVRLFTVRKNDNVDSSNKPKNTNATNTVTGNGVLQRQQNVTQSSNTGLDNKINGQRQNVTDTGGLLAEKINLEIGGVCTYKGRNFTQDKQWYDGCDFVCVCKNASRGLHKCRSRCQAYKALPLGCVLRRSNADSCCMVTDCRQATLAKGKQELASSRIFSNIQQLRRMDTSNLKRMFNHRNKMRNNNLQTDKEKINNNGNTQHVPIVKDANELLDKRNIQIIDDFIKQTNNYSKNLQKFNWQSERLRHNLKFRTAYSNRPTQNQEIVTPYSVRYKGPNNNRGNNKVQKQKDKYRYDSFRTIATQKGIYKVRKKDGILPTYAHRQPISKVDSKRISVTFPGKTLEAYNNNTSGFCEYKDRHYSKGETWFDGCKLLCVCRGEGRLICQQRCLEYSRIPDGCALIPPRLGQCCAILMCRRKPTRNNPPASYLPI